MICALCSVKRNIAQETNNYVCALQTCTYSLKWFKRKTNREKGTHIVREKYVSPPLYCDLSKTSPQRVHGLMDIKL